jgi:putative membrane protein
VGRPGGRALRNDPLLLGLGGALLFVFVWAAVAPLDRSTWLLENLLVFAALGVLLATRRRFAFSNLSYLLIALFLMLHLVGSHYTYSKVPIGFWAQRAFGLTRNHYDRWVHLAFGLLIAYPMREIALRRIHAHRIWSYLVPVLMVLASSATYEIIEWSAARVTDPQVGIAYVGAQGDVWDGQKDMALAFAGAVVGMLATAVWRGRTGHEPYLARRRSGSGRAGP